jgi:hypothetical protein
MKLLAQAINYDTYNREIGLRAELANGNLGSIISFLLPYVLTFAGIILFLMLILGGFTMLTGAADKESQDKGKKTITHALSGFVILFLAYWIAQILQVILNISIVN